MAGKVYFRVVLSSCDGYVLSSRLLDTFSHNEHVVFLLHLSYPTNKTGWKDRSGILQFLVYSNVKCINIS
jgi:hypothetical protein